MTQSANGPINSSSDTPIDKEAGLAASCFTGTEGEYGWPGDAGWGVAGWITGGVRIAGDRIAGEEGAISGVTAVGFAVDRDTEPLAVAFS